MVKPPALQSTTGDNCQSTDDPEIPGVSVNAERQTTQSAELVYALVLLAVGVLFLATAV